MFFSHFSSKLLFFVQVYRSKRGPKPSSNPAKQYLSTASTTSSATSSATASANPRKRSRRSKVPLNEPCAAAHEPDIIPSDAPTHEVVTKRKSRPSKTKSASQSQ